MRVALLTDLYPPYVGGQPIRFQELANRLAARGHDVTVCCVATDASSPTDAVEDGVRVIRWPHDTRYDNPVLKATKRGVVSTVRYAATVRRLLTREPFDVAYFNQWPFLHVLVAPKRVRVKAGIDWCELRSGTAYRVAQRALPRLVGINACVNDALAGRLSGVAHVPVCYLPSGVDTARYRAAPEAERDGLLFLGRLVDTKDLPLLIAGYRELWGRGHRIPLRIAGDGEQADVLRAAIADLPAEARVCVEVLGAVAEETKVDLLARSRVLVLPSKREGFPVVVAEAMASGLPVATVSRPDNGTSSVVERFGIGASGAPSPAGVADAVERVLGTWPECSARGLAASRDLDWDRIVDRWLDAVQPILAHS